jgi:hypothetical protein
MTLPRSAADVLAGHVLFEIESIDRMYPPHARRCYAARWLPCRGARRGLGRVAAGDSFTPADRRAGWSAICARIESGYR